MLEFQPGCIEQKPMRMEVLPEKAVVYSVTVAGITYNVMVDVLHVAAQLVHTPGPRPQLRQGVARGRESPGGQVDFVTLESSVISYGLLWFPLPALLAALGSMAQGMVDSTGFGCPSTKNRLVGFPDQVGDKKLVGFLQGLLTEGEKKDPASGFVQPVTGIDPASQLISQDLDTEPGFCLVDE
jgi:hypothetical protein